MVFYTYYASFLTRRATADKGIFEFDNVIEPLKKLFNIKEKESLNYLFLASYKNEALINVIHNYETLGFEENSRFEAIQVLNNRGITTNQLREEGLKINTNFETTKRISKDYNDHSKFAITLYAIGIILLILHFVFKNNKLPSLASASIQLSITSLINTFNFYAQIENRDKKPNLFLIILGIPFYFITHIFLKDKIKEDLKQNCLDSLK